MSEVIIKSSEIINTQETKSIGDWDQLLAHITDRQAYFLSTLAAIASKSKSGSIGWERFSLDESLQLINKIPMAQPRPEGIFTGTMWCVVASIALGRALNTLIERNNLPFRVDISTIDADFYRENKAQNPFRKKNKTHTILRLTNLSSDKIIYIDATFAQIDHQFVGNIVQIRKEKYSSHYNSTGEINPNFMSLDLYGDRMTKMHSKSKEFKHLVDTML